MWSSEWIDVNDRLPDFEGYYIVAVIGHKRAKSAMFRTSPYRRWSYREGLVTHWMPFPPLPNDEATSKPSDSTLSEGTGQMNEPSKSTKGET